jgi:hypothetical protein
VLGKFGQMPWSAVACRRKVAERSACMVVSTLLAQHVPERFLYQRMIIDHEEQYQWTYRYELYV